MKKNVKAIPSDFDWEMYLKLNKDLPRNYDENECIKHYTKFGKNENRFYKNLSMPEDFSWKTYLKLNKDLPRNYSKRECILHYLKCGKSENRSYKLTSTDLEKLDLFYYGISIDEKDEINSMENTPMDNLNNKKTIIMDSKDDCYDYLNCDLLLYTKLFNNVTDDRFLQYNVDNNVLDNLNNFILIIDFANGGGGTSFFLNTIVSKYKNFQTFVIARNYNGLLHLNVNEEYELSQKYDDNESLVFLDSYYQKISKIFINHTSGHSDEFLNELFKLNKEVITITHDYSSLTSTCQPFYHTIKKNIIANPSTVNCEKYNTIISQNKMNLNTFNNISYIVNLPDFKYSDKITSSYSSKTVIGIIGNINNIKGRKIFKKILQYFKNNKEFEFVIIGYTEIKNFKNYYYYNNINEFNSLLIKLKPNALLELSLWPETYSYSLTLGILTKLPIFALKKKIPSVVENRLKDYNNVRYFSTLNELQRLINSKTQNFFYTIKPYIYFNKFWNDLFITNKKIMSKSKIMKKNNNISPYLIYFPQFHSIKENNINFYTDYTDIINLKKYNLSEDDKLDEPLLSYLDIDSINDYNLENIKLVQKQIDLLETYNLEGFAIYYYWFSHNNVTNHNMIMEKSINNFFNDSVELKNKKIFFIWANENWTDNPAFGDNNGETVIKNMYNETYFNKNAENLLQYFKHSNYLKKDNKPVFFIYHSHLMTNELLDTFYNILNDMCIQNDFSGIHFVLNSFVTTFTKYPNFYINFNYKKTDARFYSEKKKQSFLDYKEYMDSYSVPKNTIQTIVFDFNNKPRLFQPDRLNKSTVCVNNTEFNKICFAKKIINSYKSKKTNSVENILLVNSFNEWGENMAIEPSEQHEYYYLNLLKDCLESESFIFH